MPRPTGCRFRLILGCLAVASCLSAASTAHAGHPQYWTLGRHRPGPQVQQLHPQGYAYGWFGAAPRPQGARQSGYYGLYRQWTSY